MDAELGQLDAIASNLRRVGAAGAAVAREARSEVLAAARETAAAGQTPDGAEWAPTRDGRRALPDAAGAIAAVVSGATEAVITLVLTGPYVFHHRFKGARQRRILFDPADGVPSRMSGAIARAAARVVPRLMGVR